MEDVLVVLLVFGSITSVVLAFSPLGRALADRLRGGRDVAGARELIAERAQLHDALDGVRREVAELAERVDFAERLLAQRAPGVLPPDAGGAAGRH